MYQQFFLELKLYCNVLEKLFQGTFLQRIINLFDC